jgi:hypothetical protein
MIFDQFAGIVERHLPNLLSIVNQAKLFSFPGRAHEVLSKDRLTEDRVQFLRDLFCLPFPVVAVEDSASLIILIDETPDTVGLYSRRKFIEVAGANSIGECADEIALPGGVQPREIWKAAGDVFGISIGSAQIIDYFDSKGDGQPVFRASGLVNTMYLAGKKEGIVAEEGCLKAEDLELKADYYRISSNGAVRNYVTAMEEVAFFNQPSKFVFESSPVKERKEKAGRVLRSGDRPLFTILDPAEIRTKLGLPALTESGRKSPVAHERRRHYRTLRADRFKEAKGKTIVVPASWIGPSEAVVGSRRYKVRLDI